MTGTITGLQRASAPVRPALWVSAFRCTLVYLVVPVAGPLVGLGRRLPMVLAVALILPGLVLSARSMLVGYRQERNGALLAGAALCTLNLLALVSHINPS